MRQQFEDREKRRFESGKKEINENSEEKLLKAQQDIKKKINDSMARVVREIEVNKKAFYEDINRSQEHQLIEEQKKAEQRLQRERQGFEGVEREISDAQTRRTREEARTQQLRKERNQLMSSNEQLSRKIKTHEAELMAF